MAIANNNEGMRELLVRAITEEIKKQAGELYEQKKKQLLEEFDREKERIIAGIVLNVVQMVEYESFANKIVMTIRKETPN